jgi:8-oxo-dGTP diphosphatase
MAKTMKICPQCGKAFNEYKNPVPTVDIIIALGGQGVLLVRRKNYPYGWALPGGFVDYGETVEESAVREAREETSLAIESLRQFRVYSDPARDPRQHTVSVVFTARAQGTPQAADDAEAVGVFTAETLPTPLAFDHDKILADYFQTVQNKDE